MERETHLPNHLGRGIRYILVGLALWMISFWDAWHSPLGRKPQIDGWMPAFHIMTPGNCWLCRRNRNCRHWGILTSKTSAWEFKGTFAICVYILLYMAYVMPICRSIHTHLINISQTRYPSSSPSRCSHGRHSIGLLHRFLEGFVDWRSCRATCYLYQDIQTFGKKSSSMTQRDNMYII